jgi:SAM-dependent methyltransferase
MNTNKKTINNAVISEDFYDDDLEQMQAAKNYLAWQKKLVLEHVHGNVMEIGAGVGNFTLAWAEKAQSLLALEPNKQCFDKLSKCLAGHENIRALPIFVENLDAYIPAGPTFDTVVSTNVFEHIPDDRAVLLSIIPYLKSGAKIILQVPAGQWAFGEIDIKLGHYRRYNIKMAKELFAGIPGKFLKLRYYNTIGVLGWWFNARVRKAGGQSDFQIFIFDKIVHPIQSFIEKVISIPVGQCIFLVYEYKPNVN